MRRVIIEVLFGSFPFLMYWLAGLAWLAGIDLLPEGGDRRRIEEWAAGKSRRVFIRG